MMNSFIFCLSEKLFISPSILKNFASCATEEGSLFQQGRGGADLGWSIQKTATLCDHPLVWWWSSACGFHILCPNIHPGPGEVLSEHRCWRGGLHQVTEWHTWPWAQRAACSFPLFPWGFFLRFVLHSNFPGSKSFIRHQCTNEQQISLFLAFTC